MVSPTTARSLLTTNINDNTTGDVTPADVRAVFNAAFDALDLAAAGGSIDFTKGQITGELTAPGNRSYILELSAPYPYTITALYVQTAAGTATCAVQINGTNVTGLTGIAASTAMNGGSATAANTVSVTNKVTLVVSSVAGASELSFALRYTRT